MEFWKNVQKHLPQWLNTTSGSGTEAAASDKSSGPAANGQQTGADKPKQKTGDSHLQLATKSLRQLLEDKRIPDNVREVLNEDYSQVKRMLDKLEHGHIHIAVFGRVSVGKSSLLNALLGKEAFSVSVLHGETKQSDIQNWEDMKMAAYS